MYIGPRVLYPLFLSGFTGTCIFSTGFRKKYLNTKFHKNPYSGSRVAPCGRTDGHAKANNSFSQFCKHA